MYIQILKYDLCNICPLWLGTECGYYCKYHAEETIRFCFFIIDRIVVIYYLQFVCVLACLFIFVWYQHFPQICSTPGLVREAVHFSMQLLQLSFLEFILFKYCSIPLSLYLDFQQLYFFKLPGLISFPVFSNSFVS